MTGAPDSPGFPACRSMVLAAMVTVSLCLCLTPHANAAERPVSRLAVPGPDGKLTYAPYTERGDHLPDFS